MCEVRLGHAVHVVKINHIFSGSTEKCRFMDKRLSEIWCFFVAPPRVFPLSVSARPRTFLSTNSSTSVHSLFGQFGMVQLKITELFITNVTSKNSKVHSTPLDYADLKGFCDTVNDYSARLRYVTCARPLARAGQGRGGSKLKSHHVFNQFKKSEIEADTAWSYQIECLEPGEVDELIQLVQPWPPGGLCWWPPCPFSCSWCSISGCVQYFGIFFFSRGSTAPKHFPIKIRASSLNYYKE